MDKGNLTSFLEVGASRYKYYSLRKLEGQFPGISRLPLSIRIMLESLVRNLDGSAITAEDVENLASWRPGRRIPKEIPFKVARVIMQDYTGVPALADLAAMREVVARHGLAPRVINPQVPTDLVVDHSVQADYFGVSDAYALNHKLEIERNRDRYVFLKWAQNAFSNFRLFPPGTGIIHQVHLEYIARVVMVDGGTAFFDSVVGMDSHTTMINGLGVLGWGVGGIEAEAALLDQPIAVPPPDVVGVYMYGKPREGVTATDIVLTITELLRRHNVVGKFVEFFGRGVLELSVPDRATIANMAPEYGATIGLFPVDDLTLEYLRMTGRGPDHVALVERYYREQGMFGVPEEGDVEYSEVVELDLSTVEPSVAGPSLPWQRRSLSETPKAALSVIEEHRKKRGVHGPARVRVEVGGAETDIGDGDIVIAAITSCTNTSNPALMIGAGILAKKAVERGLSVNPRVKTVLAPGSRVVVEYLSRSGLLKYLEALGFSVTGFGCMVCIGNTGPLPEPISRAIKEGDLVVSSVLSGNRNFEARIHPDVRMNFLASPPLVVAYALAGTVLRDIAGEPLGMGKDGPVYLRDIWPTAEEIRAYMSEAVDPKAFVDRYSNLGDLVPEWAGLKAPGGEMYEWDPSNTYIQRPPFFDDFDPDRLPPISDIIGARPLLILGDNVTTDHISPAGAIPSDSPAGRYLAERGVPPHEFNTYGARRGNHEVMVRGTFAHRRLRNRMLPDREGGYTVHWPSGEVMTVYDAAMRYKAEGVPVIVIAGKNYGAGSSRDWAAKGPKLLGVRAVIAESFERIHRSNLIGMGILPLQFMDGQNADTLGLDGTETYDIVGLSDGLSPGKYVVLRIHRRDGRVDKAQLRVRLDTPMEVEYFRNGGILHYVLRRIIRGG